MSGMRNSRVRTSGIKFTIDGVMIRTPEKMPCMYVSPQVYECPVCETAIWPSRITGVRCTESYSR